MRRRTFHDTGGQFSGLGRDLLKPLGGDNGSARGDHLIFSRLRSLPGQFEEWD